MRRRHGAGGGDGVGGDVRLPDLSGLRLTVSRILDSSSPCLLLPESYRTSSITITTSCFFQN